MPIRWAFFVIFSFSLIFAEESALSELCKKGIENNPKIKSFVHRTSASNSRYKQSVDRYMPQLDISGQVGYQDYDYEFSDGIINYNGLAHNYRLSLTQSVYSATLLRSMTDAKEREILANLQVDDEKAKLVAMILKNAFELLRLNKMVGILIKKEQLLKKAHSNIQKKHSLKLASQVDQYQALSRLQKTRSDLAKAKQMYGNNLFNLKLLTKQDEVEQYIKPLSFNIRAIKKSFNKIDLPKIKEGFKNNTRIKLDTQTVKIAMVQIGLRESERYPKVDAVFSYGDAGGSLDQVTRQNDTKAMLMLSFPVFQGGYVSDRTEEAQFLYYAAEEDADNTRINIKISLEKALQDIDSGLESIKADTHAIQASKKYLDAAITSYQNGLGNLTDAYLAEAEHYDNKLRLLNTEARIFNSLAEIYYFSGIADYQHIRKMQKKYFSL